LDEEWRQEDIRMKRLKAGKEKLEGVDKIEEEAAKVPITDLADFVVVYRLFCFVVRTFVQRCGSRSARIRNVKAKNH
jgi:hypothetical protein